MNFLIKNARVVLDFGILDIDLLVKEGRILSWWNRGLAPIALSDDLEIIDAENLLVLPGVIDAHTHFQLPFCGTVTVDDFAVGTEAAACGGVTTVIDFANPPSGGSILEPVIDRLAQMEGRCAIDYSIHASACGMNETSLKEFSRVVGMGITSLKLFMNYSKFGRMTSDAELFRYLEAARELGATISVHAENDTVIEYLRDHHVSLGLLSARYHGQSRPSFTEGEAIERAGLLAKNARSRLHIVHMTTGDGVDTVRRLRESGAAITCETCPQYLVLDETVFETESGHLYATCPPLRSREHVDKLWEGIRNRTIDLIATDHCVFTRTQKDAWNNDFTKIPYGMPGVETTLPLLYTAGVAGGKISLSRMVELLSVNPAKVFGLYPRKGTLLPGSDADLVIIDPRITTTVDFRQLRTPCDWSPYQGMVVNCRIHSVMVRGQVVVRDGKFIGEAGWGCFIKR